MKNMFDKNDIDSKKIADTIKKRINGGLFGEEFGQDLVGLVNNDKTRSKLRGELDNLLWGLHQDRKITSKFKTGKIDTLWLTWSLKHRIRWFLSNKMLKWIGSDCRNALDEQTNFINAAVRNSDIDIALAVPDYPYWAVEHPKGTVIANVQVVVPQSVNSIQVAIKNTIKNK